MIFPEPGAIDSFVLNIYTKKTGHIARFVALQ
jgi:hypothetical protein